MKVSLGEEGINKSYQLEFPKKIRCHNCQNDEAKIAFVAHEGFDKNDKKEPFVYQLYENKGAFNYWLHSYCAVAIYICKICLKPSAILNQG